MKTGYYLSSLPDAFSKLLSYKNVDESLKQRRNMSFKYHNGAIVSILISKDEMKIRIVSNALYEQWPIIKELL
jgi:hypothetical protein